MVVPSIEIKIAPELLTADRQLARQIESTANMWGRSVRDRLKDQSYIGATRKLRDSWDIIPADLQRDRLDFRIVIINREPTSLFRVAGRGAGKPPPISPLADWVIAKGIAPNRTAAFGIAYAIRRSIALRGTQRFRERENFLGINPDGTLQNGSILFRYGNELTQLLNSFTI